MKILTYNIGNGAHGTFQNLISFVNLEKPDILCLQETNGWLKGAKSYLKRFTLETGYNHWQYGNSNTEFDLVILSRKPISRGKTYKKGFWHCAIHVEIPYRKSSIHIWNVHLDPRAAHYRVKEIDSLLKLMGSTKNTVLTGDLNSLKSTDPYPPNMLEDLLNLGVTKFGQDNLSYHELEILTKAGLTDVNTGRFEPTVPTPHNHDPNHATNLRLDYVLSTPDIASEFKEVIVVKNIITNEISDHYPLRAILN